MRRYVTVFRTSIVTAWLPCLTTGAQEIPQPAWGPLSALGDHPGVFVCEIPPREGADGLRLPAPFPNIAAARLAGEPLPFRFNEDATEVALEPGAGAGGELRLELAEGSGQRADGRIVFSALDAEVAGDRAKLETHPGNHRIGFWNDLGDTVGWPYKASRWGRYQVSLTYSLADGRSVVEIAIGGETLRAELPATGSWYRYTTVDLGRLYLASAGEHRLSVTPKSKTGGAVMNLKAVLFEPAPEGGAIAQSGETITLHARDATVHGTRLRYEPAARKNCLGFWSDPADWASWDFAASLPGRYRILVTQGCGRGQGGSVAAVLLGEQRVEFTVEDTGGFQNWREREVGTFEIASAGPSRLEVRPVSKKAGAVMDIQQVKLVKE